MIKKILFHLFFGILIASIAYAGSGDKKAGGYIYSGPAKERIEPYLERLHLVKLEIEKREKQLKDIKKQITQRKVELAVLETKLATMEKMKNRLLFRRDFHVYVVKEGDTLWGIAAKEAIYGDPMKWETLYTANRDIIENPHQIYPGQILIVPRFD